MHINLEHAQKAIEAARKKAVSLKTQECIAVVDSGANLKAFLRMDDAWVGSIDIAIKKARTACLFAMPTGQLGKLSQPGKPLYGIEHSNDGLITFPGGLPIVDEDGVLVTGVAPWSTADERGVRAGDLVLKVQMTAVRAPEDIIARLQDLRRQGRRYVLLLVRSDDGSRSVALPLGER